MPFRGWSYVPDDLPDGQACRFVKVRAFSGMFGLFQVGSGLFVQVRLSSCSQFFHSYPQTRPNTLFDQAAASAPSPRSFPPHRTYLSYMGGRAANVEAAQSREQLESNQRSRQHIHTASVALTFIRCSCRRGLFWRGGRSKNYCRPNRRCRSNT
jgi:hypothetical protein